jgi:starch synthase
MRVSFVAAECEPWAKTGGLGDVVDALARALGETVGRPVDPVDVYLPRYRTVPLPASAGEGAVLSVRDPAAASGRTDVRLIDVAGDGYRLRLIDHPAAFDRDRFYDHPDDGWRFALLCRAALEAMRADAARGEAPVDVIHIHDWHACPVVLERARSRVDPVIAGAAVVLTLHNLAYHGWVPGDRLPELGLRPGDGLVASGADGLDLLATGVERADMVNTVSPTYAAEARTPAFGFGLDGRLKARGDRFVGILNGIDQRLWDPATDDALAATYSARDRAGKAICRADLLAQLGMDPSDPSPIVGAVGRLDPQKGFDLVADAGPTLVAAGVRIVVVASGDPSIAGGLRKLAAVRPDRVGFVERFDRELARKVYAGSDAILVPSRFEPSGLVQMIGLRYGTPPIAHATGGLVDSIIDEPSHPGEGTGFLFEEASAAALARTVLAAMAVRGERGDRPAWTALQSRGMAVDFGWASEAAPAYVELYRRAMAARAEQRSVG